MIYLISIFVILNIVALILFFKKIKRDIKGYEYSTFAAFAWICFMIAVGGSIFWWAIILTLTNCY